MKKTTNKRPHKLALCREVIALLTPAQLTNIIAGEASGTACTSIQSNETKC